MNSFKTETTIQEEFKKYMEDLEQNETEFTSFIDVFLKSDLKKVLLIETWNSRLCAVRIMQILIRLRSDTKKDKKSEKYLKTQNFTFLNWNQLLKLVNPNGRLPKFTNLTICEFPRTASIKKIEDEIMNKIIDRLDITPSKKIVFITSQKDLLNDHLKKIEMRAFLKLNQFENTVSSLISDDEVGALIEKASKGHLLDLTELLKNGVDANATRKEDGTTALHVAAENGRKDVVLTLLASGADCLPNNTGVTPLHLAAYNGHKEIVMILLENDVDVNSKDNRNRTALHDAAWCARSDIVKVLLDYDVDVNAQTYNGRSALHLSAYCMGKKWEQSADIVNALIRSNKADINIQDKTGCTPLHEAARGGSTRITRCLVHGGANVNVRNKEGKTALELAIELGHDGVVTLLRYGHKY